jgi:hypothetical protein
MTGECVLHADDPALAVRRVLPRGDQGVSLELERDGKRTRPIVGVTGEGG